MTIKMTIKKWLNKFHHGDSIELMNKMPEKSIDLFVTSPPYNLGNRSKKENKTFPWRNAKLLLEGYDSSDDNMPHDEYVKWQKDNLSAMMRLLKDDGAIFYNHKWRIQKGLIQDNREIVEDFPLRQIIIWKRGGGIAINPSFFLPTYEVIYIICKPKFKLAPKSSGIGDVWSIRPEFKNPHPAPFPIEIPHNCIKSTTAKIIMDPFMGSGSTAIAAEACGRDFIGIDISMKYCKMAKERLLTGNWIPEKPLYEGDLFD